jgi:inhibitor of the pro-sigma K processing machinery
MQGFTFPALSGVTIVLIVILVILLMKPLGKILKLVIHAAFGFVLLFVINFFFGSESYHLELNLLNCIIAGFGGIPGVVILALYKYFIA